MSNDAWLLFSKFSYFNINTYQLCTIKEMKMKDDWLSRDINIIITVMEFGLILFVAFDYKTSLYIVIFYCPLF